MLKRLVEQIAVGLPRVLDWLLSIVERVLVLGISVVIFYSAYRMMKGPADKEIVVLAKLGENWRILLLLLVPLFYRTVNRFIDEAHEAFGVKRNLQGAAIPVQGISGAAPNATDANPPELRGTDNPAA